MLRRLYDETWGRLFAWGYDRFQVRAEAAGMRDARHELFAQATGDCLEVGAGTGLNLEHWPDGITRLVLTEPDPRMAAKLRKKLPGTGRAVDLIEAPGEALPFPDDSFDTVALVFVLCTAPDAGAVLREIDRVLKPGGRFLFLEHVRAEDPGLARWQDRLHGPWYLFGHGCHCNRDTLATLEASPLEVEHSERGEIPAAPGLVRPKLTGSAVAR